MRVFIEYRESADLPWGVDVSTCGPIHDRFGARGVIVPRYLSLYYMLGYPDDGLGDHFEGVHLSKPVEMNCYNSAGASTFWAVRTRRELEIVMRCFTIAAEGRPLGPGDLHAWPEAVGKVYERMLQLEKEGFETRLVVHVE